MKQKNLIPGVLLLISILSMSSFSIHENPQDTSRGKKAQKHIVVEKTDSNGSKISLDTIIGISDAFVWNGDTIGGKSGLKWVTNNKFKSDSLLKSMNFNFEYEMDDDGEGKVIVLKSGNGGKHTIHEFVTDVDTNKIIEVRVDTDDILKDHVMIWNDGEVDETFFAPNISNIPHLTNSPNVMISGKVNGDNIIDLSDPGIISYKKKKNKDGTEKITIVRNQADKNNTEKIEKIILTPKSVNADVFFNEEPSLIEKIKVIKDSD